MDADRLEGLRREHSDGTKVKFTGRDYDFNPLPTGIVGTVFLVDDSGGVHIHWQNGRDTALHPGFDEFEILEE